MLFSFRFSSPFPSFLLFLPLGRLSDDVGNAHWTTTDMAGCHWTSHWTWVPIGYPAHDLADTYWITGS